MPDSAPRTAAKPGRRLTARERLAERLRDNPDFPSLAEAIARVNRLTSSETERVDALSEAILQDVALTHRMLRLANSSYYGLSTTDPVTSISHAILLLGFDTVRSMAMSLLLFENMPDRRQARRLQGEFMRATMAGCLARALGRPEPQFAEQAYLAGMMFRLGRMLATYYFADEAAEIARRVAAGEQEERAAREVLGVGYSTLGADAARQWGMPPTLLEAIRPPSEREIRQPASGPAVELRLLAACADEITVAIAGRDADAQEEAIAAIAQRWGPGLGIDVDGLRDAIARATRETQELAAALRLGRRPRPATAAPGTPASDDSDGSGRAAARAETSAPGAETPDPADDEADDEVDHGFDDEADDEIAAPPFGAFPGVAPSTPPAGSPRRKARLTELVREVEASLASRTSPSEAVARTLAGLHEAIGCERSVFLLHDARLPLLAGRTGLGPDISRLAPLLRVPLQARGHLFAAVARKGVDLLVQDSKAPQVAGRLPEQWKHTFGAGTFLLLPMLVRGKPLAMIYADRLQPGTLRITEEELTQLRALRSALLRGFTDPSRPPSAG